MSEGAQQIVSAVDAWLAEQTGPLVVAIDGHGGAGKTTIASEVSIALDAVVVHMDEYFQEMPETGDPRPMAQYYAWHALREQELEPTIRDLSDGRRFGSGPSLILVEGVSSAAPALADLVNRAVFVQTPKAVRLQRLHGRISDAEWDEEWLYAERLYFASRPPDSFDLVVSGAD